MKFLIVYATTDGQTRKIARFCADWFFDNGHSVELLAVAECDRIDLLRFSGIVLAGSVHIGHYQKPLEKFAVDHSEQLAKMHSLFLSVSLAAAGSDSDDLEGLEKIRSEFVNTTGWVPERFEHIAGAFKFSEYDFFRSWALRWIASQKDQNIRTDGDTEFTDWAKLADILSDWAK